MASAARRQERYRQRRDSGRAILHVEVDEIAVVELLKGNGFLPIDGDPTREEIERAAGQVLALLCRLHERR